MEDVYGVLDLSTEGISIQSCRSPTPLPQTLSRSAPDHFAAGPDWHPIPAAPSGSGKLSTAISVDTSSQGPSSGRSCCSAQACRRLIKAGPFA